jgi:hypothetical protein
MTARSTYFPRGGNNVERGNPATADSKNFPGWMKRARPGYGPLRITTDFVSV